MASLTEMVIKLSRTGLVLSAMSILLGMNATAHANTYYVAKNGNNAYTCVQAQSGATPKLTIQGALSCIGFGATAGAGHTVIVKSGTYAEEFGFNTGNTLPGGTSWTTPFTLKASPGDIVRLQPVTGPCGGKACTNIELWGRGYIIIEGLILDGTYVSYDNVRFDCDAGVINCAHHIRFLSGELYNPPGSCVIGGGEYNEFIAMKIHACGLQDPSYGHNSMYITGNYFLVENCEVYDGETGGIMFWDQNGHPNYNIARGNTVHDMREEGAGAGNAVGVGMYMGTGNLAINNVVYNIQGPGILAEYGCTQCGIYNNTSYGNTGQYGSGIGIGPYASGTVVKNNIAWGNQLRDIDQVGSDTTLANNLCATGPCTITQNPRFVDAAGKNFRLLPGSPAFNAGIDLASIVKNDILGTPRPQDGAFDLGAYECTCGAGDTTPPGIPRNVRVQ